MANIKPDDSENSIWQGYSLQAPPATSSHPPPFESSYASPALTIPYHGRPQKSSYRSLDIPSIHTRPPPREGNGVLTASPPSLNTHHSYPSLKRAFHTSDDLPYGENVQDFREELPADPKPTINQDHRLLSFARLPEKRTVLDGQGRVQQIELQAQIHGMFFLSELATPSSEPLLVQPELTCYRRNLFQISGNVTTPRGPISLITERGERIAVVSLEVTISATESVDGHVVKLIVIPWKTPPPNSPEVGPGQEHEPTPIPLEPFDDGRETNSDFTVYPIAYRRLQFRIATANNGRRRELQQHFTLHLNVVGTLANGTKTNVCETSTAPIVVRGRSPRNFQARKEIPLVGSSSSRGQPPELHVSTGNMPIGIPSDGKGKPLKAHTLELPRSPFTFDSANIQGSPSLIRQSTWNVAHASDHSTTPNTPSYPAPAIGLENYLQVNHSNPDISQHPSSHSPTASLSATQAHPPSMRQQYAYHPASAPPTGGPPIRFIDSNPRPTKSPRHVAPPDLPANGPYSEYGTRFAPPYSGPAEAMPTRGADYFPTTLPMQAWTSAPGPGSIYGTSAQQQQQQQPASSSQHVRRSDLYTRSRSTSPAPSSPVDPELERQLQARLADIYGPLPVLNLPIPAKENSIPIQHPPSTNADPDPQNEDEEAQQPPTFEFRLFSSKPSTTSTSQTNSYTEPQIQQIILQDSDSDLGEGGFIIPHRKHTYYFAEKASGDKKKRIESVALTGEEVAELARRRAWGLECPWRVRVLRVSAQSTKSKSKAGETVEGKVECVDINEEEGEKRKQPGKKRRIILREREKKKKEERERKLKEKELMEETEREKRTRRNREKKVKKRLKEKAKKAEGVGLKDLAVATNGNTAGGESTVRNEEESNALN
ncbi:hypothetical protein G7Y89_g13855 [Cudoniella acicularis]|uniref:NDT80 domain-containing protein n=1 Tax=Cudoniella acicularis TaxID=354080 RepID=A0A8H4R6N9_9HELO|nr:hypothetical protein G7Y89_g13855 [Cudoniella acicularis]